MTSHNQKFIVSNNPAVLKSFPKCIAVPGSPLDVMREVRIRVQRGFRLIGHPLAGSIRLLRNPYRTVVLGSPEMGVDDRDLMLVEEAFWRLSQRTFDGVPETLLSDYRSVDLELVQVLIQGGNGMVPNQL